MRALQLRGADSGGASSGGPWSSLRSKMSSCSTAVRSACSLVSTATIMTGTYANAVCLPAGAA
eukprot:6436487-Prymnesium_polylepis.1